MKDERIINVMTEDVNFIAHLCTMRGMAEFFGLHVLERKGTAAQMPSHHMVCRYKEKENVFQVVESFTSDHGPYVFLRSVIEFIRRFIRDSDGVAETRKFWEGKKYTFHDEFEEIIEQAIQAAHDKRFKNIS